MYLHLGGGHFVKNIFDNMALFYSEDGYKASSLYYFLWIIADIVSWMQQTFEKTCNY